MKFLLKDLEWLRKRAAEKQSYMGDGGFIRMEYVGKEDAFERAITLVKRAAGMEE